VEEYHIYMNTKEEENFPYYLIQQFSDGLHALLFIVNKENTIEFANEKFLTYFECTSMDALRTKTLSLFKYVSGSKKLKNYTELHQYILPNEHRTLSINDDIFILDTTKLDTDKMLFTLKKVTKIFNKKADLEKEVAYDSLTGLLRKKYLDIELEMLLEKKENLVLIVVDIDDFKAINDVYGHSTGDIVLKEFSVLLQDNLRKEDLIARWGGEEFLIVIKNISEEMALEKAELLRCKITEYHFTQVKKLSASFGMAYLHKNDDIHTLLQRADKALYKAKNNGKNKVILKTIEKSLF